MPVRLTWMLVKAITREICHLITDFASLPCVILTRRSLWDLKTQLNFLSQPREEIRAAEERL